MNEINFHNKKFTATKTAPNGVINNETVFEFEQNQDAVIAKYSGGKIKAGFLIGKILNENKFEFRFTQMHIDGVLDGGHSFCDIVITDDGRIRLIEHFEWQSTGEKGENIIEEIR